MKPAITPTDREKYTVIGYTKSGLPLFAHIKQHRTYLEKLKGLK